MTNEQEESRKRAMEQLRKEADETRKSIGEMQKQMGEFTVLLDRVVHNLEGVRNNQAGWAEQMAKRWDKFDKLYEATLQGNHESRIKRMEEWQEKTDERLYKFELFVNKLNTFWLVVPGVAAIVGTVMALVAFFEKILK